MNQQLNTAVIGLGRIAWSDHLPAIIKNSRFHLSAVADPLKERGEEAIATFGADRSYESAEALFRQEKIDVAVITSPTIFHEEHVILALEHGCHVFCDKPMTLSLASARRMSDTAKLCEKKLMVFQPRRLNIQTDGVKTVIRSGKLGPIYQCKLFIGNYSRRNDWQALLKNGGGMLNNYGNHYIDQMLYATGAKIRNLFCHTAIAASVGDADDVVKIVMQAEDGMLLDLDINQAAALTPPNLWFLFGKYGTARMMEKQKFWELRYFHPEDNDTAQLHAQLAAENRQYPSDHIHWITETMEITSSVENITESYYDNLYRMITANAPPIVPLEETLELMRLIELSRDHANVWNLQSLNTTQ